MKFNDQSRYCHAERSEASRCPSRETLRFAQGDNTLPILIVKLHHHARLPPSLTIVPYLVAQKHCSSPISPNLEQILKFITCISHLSDLEYECHLERLLNHPLTTCRIYLLFLLSQQRGLEQSRTVPTLSVLSSAITSCLLADT